ncbi:MAG: SDR family oxidoreductase, partial [Bacillota bacterium]|nr:SDR family oxidoreductase [Bacillota bacterium]
GISKIGLFIDSTEEDWNYLIDTNLKGTFNMTHSVLKHMMKFKSGSILNISSIWGVNGASCETVYSSTKGAIISFTKALAKEMGPSGIRVNALAPGIINTGMNNWLTEEEKAELTEDIPLCTMGDPMDIGNAAAFLCSDESRYITGQTLIVDGGFL